MFLCKSLIFLIIRLVSTYKFQQLSCLEVGLPLLKSFFFLHIFLFGFVFLCFTMLIVVFFTCEIHIACFAFKFSYSVFSKIDSLYQVLASDCLRILQLDLRGFRLFNASKLQRWLKNAGIFSHLFRRSFCLVMILLLWSKLSFFFCLFSANRLGL